MDDEEEKLFLERLTLKGWKARAEGAIRSLQAYLGHASIMHTVRYTEMSPTRFRAFGSRGLTRCTPNGIEPPKREADPGKKRNYLRLAHL